MKRNINGWAREQIKSMMLQEAIKLQVKYKGAIVQKFSQIGAAYAKDGTAPMQKLMHQVLYTNFLHQRGWANKLEEKYMKEKNIQYQTGEEHLNDRKGFIEILINEQYSELKRGITDRAKKAHGRFIRLREEPKLKGSGSGDGSEEQDDVVGKPPRKKSLTMFDESFVRIVSKNEAESSSEQPIEVHNGATIISAEEWEELLRLRTKNKELEAMLSVYEKQEEIERLTKDVEMYKNIVAEQKREISELRATRVAR